MLIFSVGTDGTYGLIDANMEVSLAQSHAHRDRGQAMVCTRDHRWHLIKL